MFCGSNFAAVANIFSVTVCYIEIIKVLIISHICERPGSYSGQKLASFIGSTIEFLLLNISPSPLPYVKESVLTVLSFML